MDNNYDIFYKDFIDKINSYNNKFTLSTGYLTNFINSETIKIIWRCVSVNNKNTPTIYYGFEKELYFTLEKPKQIKTNEFDKQKVIERITNPYEFLQQKPYPKSFEKKYKSNNWKELHDKIDINKAVYINQTYLFQLYRYHLKNHYNNERGYTLPKALLTLRNIKKVLTHDKDYYEFEEIKELLKNYTNYELQPCKALSAIAFNSIYNTDDILLPYYENEKMYICISSICQEQYN